MGIDGFSGFSSACQPQGFLSVYACANVNGGPWSWEALCDGFVLRSRGGFPSSEEAEANAATVTARLGLVLADTARSR